jgi:hypothetical protein
MFQETKASVEFADIENLIKMEKEGWVHGTIKWTVLSHVYENMNKMSI